MTPPMSPMSPSSPMSPTSPLSPTSPTFRFSTLSPSPYAPYNNRERAQSVLYSPHGAPYSLVKSWAQKHLVKESALPLTALIHGFDMIENPWYLGGVINNGLPNGCEIARNLQARCWIGAHDADKEVTGVGTRMIRKKKFGWEEIWRHLDEKGIDVNYRKQESLSSDGSEAGRSLTSTNSAKSTGKRIRMDVRMLEVGEEYRIAGV